MIQVEDGQLDAQQTTFLERFDLGAVLMERVLPGGMFARPMLLDTARGRCVLRTHTFRSTEPMFRFQAEAIDFVADRGVTCARALRTRDGAWSQSLREGGGVLALHDYIDGRCDDWHAWHRRKETRPGFLAELGGRVATMHHHLACARPGGEAPLPLTLPPIRFNELEAIRDHWKRSIERLRLDETAPATSARIQMLQLVPTIESHWSRLAQALSVHKIGELPTQIVHGDVSAVNLVFDSHDVPTPIDWDCLHVGHRLYDALGDVLNRPPVDRPDLNVFRVDHVEQYVEGYASASTEPLIDRERKLTPAFCLARQLEDLRQRLRVLPTLSTENDDEYARLIGMRVAMMDQITLT